MSARPKKKFASGKTDAPATLWLSATDLDRRMLAYTVGDDRRWDAQLLPWDIFGSLGHVEGLRASGLLSAAEAKRLRAGLRGALIAARDGRLQIAARHEDCHSAVEDWLTRRLGALGGKLHTGRSRNDQIVCTLRLFLKDRLLALSEAAVALVAALLRFSAAQRHSLWPGYTHTRRAMPSSAGLWAAGYAEGLLATLAAFADLWRQADRCPLGSAAGYGAPLPLKREAAARALGFSRLDLAVTTVQGGRGKLEAAALFYCSQLMHELGRLAGDLILFSGEEFALLQLPAALTTGSSLMPQKRNPDLFELTRARAAAVDGELGAVLRLKGGLSGGYHRDFQLLKPPLLRGLAATEEALAMMAAALPRLKVNRARGEALLAGGVLATDAVMKKVRAGRPFRAAYRDIAAALHAGGSVAGVSSGELLAARRSTGGLGNLPLAALGRQLQARRRVLAARRRAFRRLQRLRH